MKLEHEMLKKCSKIGNMKKVKGLRGRRQFQLEMVSMMYGQQHHLNSAMFNGDQYYASSGYSGVSEYEYYSDGENCTNGQFPKPL